MNTTPDTTAAENDGNFDPRQAAELLDQTTQQARRTFSPGSPLLWAYRAAFVLVAFGDCWLSVRGQHPYTGPDGSVLPVVFVLVAINIAWSVSLNVRAGRASTAREASSSRTFPALDSAADCALMRSVCGMPPA